MTAPRLHVVREGEGPFVFLSHALGCDLHMWDGVAALLADAAASGLSSSPGNFIAQSLTHTS